MSKKKVSITPTKNGPYVVKNLSQLTESSDRKVDVEKEVIGLCRCGESCSKPYCDGTHGKIEFNSEQEDVHDPRFVSDDDEIELKINENSPYTLKGFKDETKDELKEHYALCRCGHSDNKPFCDGTHHKVNFKDDGLVKKRIKKESTSNVPFQNKYKHVKELSENPSIAYTSMRTLERFPDFSTLLFKANQLYRMPLSKSDSVSLKTVIGPNAKYPLEIELPFFVSHMSYGAISKEAKIALAKGSHMVNTAMASGEGGLLPESKDAAKYYIYEQGTAEFTYDEEAMKRSDAVELKIGQGVKPGLGGYLPADKITEELAKVRNLKPGEASEAPNRLHGINTIDDLKERVKTIRELIDGKPVGIKISTGYLEEDLKLAVQANPDFITIDCRGGATGAAPTFLKDNVGIPAIFAIPRARAILDATKQDISLIATGNFRDSTDIAKGIALGADAIALATASLMAIGCIQARVCHTGKCPVGIATQDNALRRLLDIEDAARGYANFATGTAKELTILARSHGLDDIHKLSVNDLMTTSDNVSNFTPVEHV